MIRSASVSICFALGAAISSAGPLAGAQEVIPDRETCHGCGLSLTQLRTVGDLPGQELFDDIHRWIVEDSQERIWVPNLSIGHVLQVYGKDGTYSEFERQGDGPGEFRRVSMMACVADGFLLMDVTRYSLINPLTDSLTYLFTTDDVGFRSAKNAVQVNDSTIWVSSPSRHPSFLGFPILVLDLRLGRVRDAYGKEVEHYDRIVERYTGRFLASLGGNRIISVPEFAYEVRTRALNGNLLRHYVRDAPWFRPDADAVNVLVTGVQAIDAETVAVFMAVRDESAPVPAPEAPSDATLAEAWNGLVEVLDLRRGEVLKRMETPDFPVGPICPTENVAMLSYSHELGADYIKIIRLEWSDTR